MLGVTRRTLVALCLARVALAQPGPIAMLETGGTVHGVAITAAVEFYRGGTWRVQFRSAEPTGPQMAAEITGDWTLSGRRLTATSSYANARVVLDLDCPRGITAVEQSGDLAFAEFRVTSARDAIVRQSQDDELAKRLAPCVSRR